MRRVGTWLLDMEQHAPRPQQREVCWSCEISGGCSHYCEKRRSQGGRVGRRYAELEAPGFAAKLSECQGALKGLRVDVLGNSGP